MKKLLKKFNKRSYTLENVYRICRRERINIVFYPMIENVRGYYQTERKNIYRKKYICVNDKVTQKELLSILLHELVHHFLHATAEFKRQTFFCRLNHINDSKQDYEADVISLIMEIPQAKLFELLGEDLECIKEYANEKLIKRLAIYKEFGE